MQNALQPRFTYGVFLCLLLSVSGMSVARAQMTAYSAKLPLVEIGPDQQDKEKFIPLVQALKMISTTSDVNFNYRVADVQNIMVEKKIAEEVSQNIENQLGQLLGTNTLTYKKVSDGYYVIVPKQELQKINKKMPESSSIHGSGSLQFFSPRPLSSQNLAKTIIQQTISGKVIDLATDEGLPGVNILAKGTSTGTVTDINGNYRLSVEDDVTTLVFSSIGYESEEIQINGRAIINVSLSPDIKALQEVLVVGYGTQKKSDLTGSVASVSEEELTAYPASSAVQALQGRAAGVTVQSTNGEPGAGYKIRIRGGTSINASSDPLFVVDGLVGAVLPPPEDIASIEVLKDASATAIYGSRGANGVVMITTKSGESGKTQVNFNTSYSLQNEIGRLDVLNAPQFAEYINEARGTDFYDLNNLEADTDWQDLIFQQGNIQNYQLSVSGGKEDISYYVSGVLYDQKGVVETSEYNRMSLTTNLKFDVSERIRLNLNSLIFSSKQNGVQTQAGHGGGGDGGVITNAQRFEPTVGILDENGEYNDSKVGIAPFDNPMAVIRGREQEHKRENLQTNLKAEFDLAEGLVFNSTFGIIFRNQVNGVYNNRISNEGETSNGEGSINNRRNFNFLTENYLNYDVTLGGKHNLVLTGGYSYQRFTNEFFVASNQGFISDALSYWNLSAGSNLQTPNSSTSESEISSFYGRANYNFDERYLLTFTGRYDGASQFSEGNKWSFFPSGAFSWNIDNESFFPENNTMTGLKLRTSYGLTGNQAIGPYESLARISPTFFVLNGSIVNSVRPTAIANKELTWETTAQFDIGVDAEFLAGRLNLTADYYRKLTSDLLFEIPIPAFSGYTSRLENIGEIENKGFEFLANSKNLVGNFKWSTSFNITLNRNKVVKLPDGNDIIYAGAPGYLINGALQHAVLREGEPVGSFYGYVYEGVYQEGEEFITGGSFETEPGGEKFADLNGDDVLNDKDRKIIGDPNPDAIWGLNNDFSYKGFDLNIFFQAYTGGDIMNFTKMELDRLSGNSNATTDALNRWTPENTNTDVPKATAGRVSRTSTRFMEDGSFIRLKNISLGYNFSSELLNRLKIRKARLYVSAQNLLTFTKYSGVDPEVAYKSSGSTNSNINLGLDYGSYPNTVAYTFGINLGF